MDVDIRSAMAAVDRDAKSVGMRIAHVHLDHIATLVLFDSDAVPSDLVMGGGHLGFNRVLIPCGDVNVCVRCIHAKVGFASQCVSLRPFVSARGRHTLSQPLRRSYAESVRSVPQKP